MHFDDRLETVLRLAASGDGLARIQYRQLVDLLGCMPDDGHSGTVDAAFTRLEALSRRIPASDRARLLRQPLQPITNPLLLAALVEAEPDVASAAIGAARLDDAQWRKLIPALPVRARGILRHRRDLSPEVEAVLERLGIGDRALPPVLPCPAKPDAVEPETPVTALPSAETSRFSPLTGDLAVDQDVSDDVLDLLDLADDPPPPTSLSDWAQARAAQNLMASAPMRHAVTHAGGAEAGIGAIVRRIEEFRKARQAHAASQLGTEAPRLPLGDAPQSAPPLASAIDFATDAQGRITWADGPHAPSVIGLNLSAGNSEDEDAVSFRPAYGPDLATAIRHRQPLRGARLAMTGAPAVSGQWQVDAIARFDPASGRFTGYCGRLRRPAALVAVDNGQAAVADEADRMRQILHELRTPANAIQVAAEIIQQQLYGPAPHEYRALAAAIAGDCAHILAGFEELDRLVRLETGALALEPGECDLTPVLAQTIARLRTWTQPRRSGFATTPDPAQAPLPVRMDRSEAERLVWRLFAALAGTTAPDEMLDLSWTEQDGLVAITVAMPAVLAARPPEALFDTPTGERGPSLSAGMFGIGFTLRLVAAEAAAAGGGLHRVDNALHLTLPGLTLTETGHSTTENRSHQTKPR